MIDDRLKVDVLAIVDFLHDRDGGFTRGQSGGLVAVAVDDVVDAPLIAIDGLAVSDRKADEVLQFDGDVLDHVASIGAVPDPLQEAAWLPDRASMLVYGGDQVLEPLGDPLDLVARPVFQFLNVEPHVDRLVAAVVIRPAKCAVFKYMQSYAPGFWP